MQAMTHYGIGMTSRRTRARLVERLRARGIDDEKVLQAIDATPRHIFVDEALASRAYEDTALPIGYGQTISQPYIVALMTEVLVAAGVEGKVLEVGTGCGYQTSVLARVVRQVVSIERVQPLLAKARAAIRRQSLHNVHTIYGDGYQGWPALGPYQGILVTACPERVPSALLEQLDEGGVLVAPIGSGQSQRLVRMVKTGASLVRDDLGEVSFVPLLAGLRPGG